MTTKRPTKRQQAIQEKYDRAMGRIPEGSQPAMLPQSRTCYFCSQEKPIAEFSTLARWGSYGEITNLVCTRCFWVVFILYRAEYRPEGPVYVSRETRDNDDLMNLVKRSISGWIVNEKVIKRYSVLGDMEAQIAPFRQFLKDLRDGRFSPTPFTPGRLVD